MSHRDGPLHLQQRHNRAPPWAPLVSHSRQSTSPELISKTAKEKNKHPACWSKLRGTRRCVVFLLAMIWTCLICMFVIFYIMDPTWNWENRFLYACWLPELLNTQPLLMRKPHKNNHKLVYLTAKFGPKPDTWSDEVQAHCERIARRQVFDEIIAYTDFPDWILNNTLYEKHVMFRRTKSFHRTSIGGGYWFWKPVLIHHHLKQLHDNDFLVYSDADRTIAPWTALLIDTMMARDANLAAEQMPFLERQYDKRDVYEHFCDGDPTLDETTQYNANWLAIRKTPSTLNLTSQWAEAAADYHLISDERSILPNVPDFAKPRRDQSIFSLLLKCVYEEPYKTVFSYTCLRDWSAYTFKL